MVIYADSVHVYERHFKDLETRSQEIDKENTFGSLSTMPEDKIY